MSAESLPVSCTIIGSGRVAKALAAALSAHDGADFRLEKVLARNTAEAKSMARNNGAPIFGAISDLAEIEGLVLLCVSDDAIAGIAAQLAELPAASGACVVHFSGAHDLIPLAPLQECGVRTGSFHPLQSFPEGAGATTFRGIYASLLGEPDVITLLSRFARTLGCSPVPVDARQKKQLHLAAVFASNYMVALASLAERAAPGLPQPATELLRPLMETTLQNIFTKGTTAALTGPVSRGDTSTVKAHLSSLASDDSSDGSELSDAYRLLGRAAAGIARSDNRLTPETYDELLALLHDREAR